MTKHFKMAVALAVLTASLTSATAVNAGNPKDGNLTSLCGKIWKPRC
jgi:hypothetical protein